MPNKADLRTARPIAFPSLPGADRRLRRRRIAALLAPPVRRARQRAWQAATLTLLTLGALLLGTAAPAEAGSAAQHSPPGTFAVPR